MGLFFRPSLGMVTVGVGAVDLAHPVAFRPNPAQQLDSRGTTHDVPGHSNHFLVAISESHFDHRLRRRIGLCLHHNSAYKRPRSSSDLCASTLVLVLHHNRSRLGSHRSGGPTTWWIDHVDSGGDPTADCCSLLAREMDERIADSMAIHTDGGTGSLI